MSPLCALILSLLFNVPTGNNAVVVVDRLYSKLGNMTEQQKKTVNCENAVGRNCQMRLPPTAFDQDSLDAWWQSLTQFSEGKRLELEAEVSNFNAYDNPLIKWASSSYIQAQVMVHDRFLYDRATGEWTIDRYLDDLKERYGGLDAVLLWQGYPNIGVDDRNQFDLIRSLPGGIEGISKAVQAFHARDVKVFFPYFLWDRGTRNEGAADYETLVGLVVELDADGINGDTCDGFNSTWWEESVRLAKPLALEAQSMGSKRYGYDDGWENVTTNVMSWGESWKYTDAPLVSTYKAIEHRHMVQITERFAENRTDGIHHAFFNGVGYETWENIWNMFNKITERDSELIRRMSSILRECSPIISNADVLRPFIPGVLVEGVFATKFTKDDREVIFLVNRRPVDRTSNVIQIDCLPGDRIYNLLLGYEFSSSEVNCSAETAILSFHLEGLGIGAIFRATAAATQPSAQFLNTMRTMTAKALSSFSKKREFLPQTMTAPTTAISSSTEGMVEIPAPPNGVAYDFVCDGNIPQGDLLATIVDVQFPFEASPQRKHRQLITMTSIWMDKNLVTNQDYKTYLDSSGWKPRDESNWLRHWIDGTFPEGWENKPVQWVSRDDAKVFCEVQSKRLPHTHEWQYAAQGTEGLLFPWGNDFDSKLVPAESKSRDYPIPDDVGSHPRGASPFGVLDMLGNVFQWTDEFVDEHSVLTVVRGGSNYVPHGASSFYFTRPKNLLYHNTLLSMSDSMDRSAGIGFRCVSDMQEEPACPWQLCGSFVPTTTTTVTDLSVYGNVDWAHFGYDSELDIIHKAKGGRTISVALIAAGTPSQYLPIMHPTTPVINYRWDDGPANAPIITGTGHGIYINPSTSVSATGFTLTIQPPTSATLARARVFIGVYRGVVRLSASAGGGNAFSSERIASPRGATQVEQGTYEIDWRISDEWPLTLTMNLEDTFDSGAQLALFAVTVSNRDTEN